MIQKAFNSSFLISLVFFSLIQLRMADHLQAQFTLDAEIRPRSEYRHGYKTLEETGHKVHLGLAYNQTNDPANRKNYSVHFILARTTIKPFNMPGMKEN